MRLRADAAAVLPAAAFTAIRATLGSRATLAVPVLAAATLVLGACASSGSGSDAIPDRRAADMRIADQRDAVASTVTLYSESSTTAFLLPRSPGDVWLPLQQVWSALDLQATDFDQQRMLIGNEGFRTVRIAGERMAHWVDCGSGMTGPNANRFDVVITLYTALQAHVEGTELVVEMDGRGKPRDYSGNWMHCESTGRLEALMAELVSARL